MSNEKTVAFTDFETDAIKADSLDRDQLLSAFRSANIALAQTLVFERTHGSQPYSPRERYYEAAAVLGQALSRRYTRTES